LWNLLTRAVLIEKTVMSVVQGAGKDQKIEK